MSNKPNGGFAFPANAFTMPNGDFDWGRDGMTLRDYFAGQALSHFKCDPWSDNPLYWENVARSAYVCADAMLVAREK